MPSVVIRHKVYYHRRKNWSVVEADSKKILRGIPPSESRFFSKNSIFQKAHILVALNVLFQNMYKAYMNRAYLTQFWSDYLKL